MQELHAAFRNPQHSLLRATDALNGYDLRSASGSPLRISKRVQTTIGKIAVGAWMILYTRGWENLGQLLHFWIWTFKRQSLGEFNGLNISWVLNIQTWLLCNKGKTKARFLYEWCRFQRGNTTGNRERHFWGQTSARHWWFHWCVLLSAVTHTKPQDERGEARMQLFLTEWPFQNKAQDWR